MIARIKCWNWIGTSVMAIAGVPATAYEMARVLEHSFKYYRRTQLQELSFEGKLRARLQITEGECARRIGWDGSGRASFWRI